MRLILCLLVVCVFATTAPAQFGNKAPAGRNAAKPAETTQKKTANEKGNLGKAAAGDLAAAENDVVDALLIAMDADRDGIVTKIEMNKAMAALRKVHKDNKGNMVVPDKAATDPNAAAVPGAEAGLGQGPGGVGAPATAGGRNNEAMGRFMQMDTNQDGRLTLDEVPPQVAVTLRDADVNRDGAIDAREMQAYIARMGERARAFGAGVNPNGGAKVPGERRAPKP